MRKNEPIYPPSSESGSVMIFVLFIMMIVTIIGISATSSSTFESLIATNDQHYRMAFYNAECGIYGIPKMISLIVNESSGLPVGNNTNATGLSYLQSGGKDDTTDSNNLYDQLAGYTAYDNMNRDIGFSQDSDIGVDIDIRRAGALHLAGSGVEFATGYEGVGPGSVGGIGLFYRLDSLGRTNWDRTSQQGNSTIRATYRKVLGTAGGL